MKKMKIRDQKRTLRYKTIAPHVTLLFFKKNFQKIIYVITKLINLYLSDLLTFDYC